MKSHHKSDTAYILYVNFSMVPEWVWEKMTFLNYYISVFSIITKRIIQITNENYFVSPKLELHIHKITF